MFSDDLGMSLEASTKHILSKVLILDALINAFLSMCQQSEYWHANAASPRHRDTWNQEWLIIISLMSKDQGYVNSIS